MVLQLIVELGMHTFDNLFQVGHNLNCR